MKEKFVNLTKDEIGSINGFIENYEMFLERQGYTFTSIKDISMKKREGIFHQIEMDIEDKGSYDLPKILENEAKTRVQGGYRDDAKEVVFKIPIPEIFSLFRPPNIRGTKAGLFKPIKPFKIKKRLPRNVKKIKAERPVQVADTSDKVQEEIITKEVQEFVTQPEYFVDNISDLLYFNTNIKEMKYFTRKKFAKINNANKKFHRFFFVIALLSAIVATVMIYDANINNKITCFSRYNRFDICYYYGVAIENWYLAGLIIASTYLSILTFYLIMKIYISISRGIYERKMGKIILFSQKGMSQRQYEKYEKIINKLVYEGILFPPNNQEEDK